MSLEKAVRAILIADVTVTAIVSERVYPQRRPTGSALPAIVYQNVYSHQRECIGSQAGLRRTRFSIDVIDETYGDTKTLRDAVESALVNYTGTLQSETIHSLRLESAVDIDEENTPAGQFGVFRTILDFVIWHN